MNTLLSDENKEMLNAILDMLDSCEHQVVAEHGLEEWDNFLYALEIDVENMRASIIWPAHQ